MIPSSILLFLVASLIFLNATGESSTTHLNNYVNHFCLNTTGNYTQGSNFQHNLNTLLSVLEYNSSTTSFFATTITDLASEDQVFGRYYCRHDLSLDTCRSCVKTTTKRVISECPTSKEAIMFFEHCTLVYLNSSARLDDHDIENYLSMLSFGEVMDVDKFQPVVIETVNRLINESAYGSNSDGFSTAEVMVSQFETLHSLTQCSKDMSGVLCERCLKNALNYVGRCCKEVADMEFFYPSCQLRYSVVAPFYMDRGPPAQISSSPPPPPVAQAEASSDHKPTTQGNGAESLSCRNMLQLGLVMTLISAKLILRN